MDVSFPGSLCCTSGVCHLIACLYFGINLPPLFATKIASDYDSAQGVCFVFFALYSKSSQPLFSAKLMIFMSCLPALDYCVIWGRGGDGNIPRLKPRCLPLVLEKCFSICCICFVNVQNSYTVIFDHFFPVLSLFVGEMIFQTSHCPFRSHSPTLCFGHLRLCHICVNLPPALSLGSRWQASNLAIYAVQGNPAPSGVRWNKRGASPKVSISLEDLEWRVKLVVSNFKKHYFQINK